MNSNADYRKMMTALAVMVIAFGALGIALADEADAADAVQYKVGNVTYTNGDEAGAAVALPTLKALGATAPAGKTFLGWGESADATTYYTAGTAIATAAATYYAILGDVTYTVTFDPANGDEPTVREDVAYDGSAQIPDQPYEQGYIFAYWADAAGKAVKTVYDESNRYDVIEGITADVTYTAIYTIDYAYSVVVDGTTIAKGSVSDSGNVNSISTPAKAGYTFAGWDNGSEVIAFGDLQAAIAEQTADTVYTATWSPIILAVGFEGIDVSESIPYGTLAIEPAATPSKEGYTFAGWDFDFATPITESITIKAVWSAIVIPDPEPTPATVTYVVDGLTVYDPATPSKEGYVFVGWNDGSRTVSAADLSEYLASLESGSTVTLTAVFEPIVYTVTFTADTITVLTQSVKYGEFATEPAVQPAKAGFDFAGWDYDFSVPVTSDLTIKALYTETPAPVDPDAPVTITYIVDGLTVYSAATPAKIGYRFVGWNDGTEVIAESDLQTYIAALSAGSFVTLTAVFEALTYTVTFTSLGEVVTTETVAYGGLAVLPAVVPTNLDFDHWDYDFSVPITADTEIKAVAVVVTYYTVTFDYGYPGVNSVTETVADGATVAELPVIYPYMGDVTWSITTETPITADTTATLVAIAPAVPDEPETPTETEDENDNGVLVEVAIIVVIIAALAIAGIVLTKKGTLATLKAKKDAKKSAKAGNSEQKP